MNREVNNPSPDNSGQNHRDSVAEESSSIDQIEPVIGEGRYQVLENISPDSARALDTQSNQVVLLRRVTFTLRKEIDSWRQRARELAEVRHPNFLNLLSVGIDDDPDCLVSERSIGVSASNLRRSGFQFSPDEAFHLLLGLCSAIDLAGRFTLPPNFISSSGLFIESEEIAKLRRLPVPEWPDVPVKLDVFDLLKPTLFPVAAGEVDHESPALAIRQAAMLLYDLLGGYKSRRGPVESWFEPVPSLNEAANSALYAGLEWSSVFENSENFLRSVELANSSGPKKKFPKPIETTRTKPLQPLSAVPWFAKYSFVPVLALLIMAIVPLLVWDRLSKMHPIKISVPVVAVEPSPTADPDRSFLATPPVQIASDQLELKSAAADQKENNPQVIPAATQESAMTPAADPHQSIVQDVHVPAVASSPPRVTASSAPHHAKVLVQQPAPSKQDVLRKIEMKWGPREAGVDREIGAIDKRLTIASGQQRENLATYKTYLKKRKDYMRRMCRYEKVRAGRAWNRENGYGSIFDPLLDTFGL
jgi:hypothetical protein